MRKLLAALIFFTRLPFWRLGEVPSDYYKRVVELWPVIGWLTGSLSALTVYLAWHVFTPVVAVALAFLVRILITGALHEDGLADFCDGMGGGTSRERILAIMKDSHIGTYGVIGLIIYYILAVGALSGMSQGVVMAVMFAADAWSKWCAAQIINFLPYSRTEAQAKNRTVYTHMSFSAIIVGFLAGSLPLIVLPFNLLPAAGAPVIVSFLLILLMRHKLGGYTGDCCGATFLLSELSFFLTASAIYRLL